MFGNVVLYGLETLPISDYHEYVADVNLSGQYQKDTFDKELLKYLCPKDFKLFNVKGQDKIVLKKSSSEDKTYLIFDYKTLLGQAMPDDMRYVFKALKQCKEVNRITPITDKNTYILTDEEYRTLIMNNSRQIVNSVLEAEVEISADKDIAYEKFKNLGKLFAIEKKISREGVILMDNSYDAIAASSAYEILTISWSLGYFDHSKELLAQYNANTQKNAKDKMKKVNDALSKA